MKWAVCIITFFIGIITSLFIWYINPGFDPVAPGDVIESGSYFRDGFSGEWKICKTDTLSDLPSILTEYSYSYSLPPDLKDLYAEKFWLYDNRFRRITILWPDTDANATLMTNNIALLGAATRLRAGECYAFIWSGYSASIDVFLTNISTH